MPHYWVFWDEIVGRIRIHRATCGACKYGTGVQGESTEWPRSTMIGSRRTHTRMPVRLWPPSNIVSRPSISRPQPADHTFERRDLCLVVLKQISCLDIIVERFGFELRATQSRTRSANVVSAGEFWSVSPAMKSWTICVELDAVGAIVRHSFHPEARSPQSIPCLQSVHRQGRTPASGHFLPRRFASAAAALPRSGFCGRVIVRDCSHH